MLHGALFEKTAPCSIWTREASAKAFYEDSHSLQLKRILMHTMTVFIIHELIIN